MDQENVRASFDGTLSKRFLVRLNELASRGRFGKIRTVNASYIKLLGIISRLLEMPAYPLTLWGEEGSGKNLLAEEICSFSNLLSRLEGYEVKGYDRVDGRLAKIGFSEQLLLESSRSVVFEHVDALSKDMQKELLKYLIKRRDLIDAGQLVAHRVIFLTQYSLSFKVLKKDFIRELFVFLNPTLLCVPTLNERIEDLPFIFSEILMDLTGHVGHIIDPALIDHLETQIWGRNIDQLKKEIEHRLPMNSKENRWTLEKWNLFFARSANISTGFQLGNLPDLTQNLRQRKQLQHALHKAGGNRDQAARLLGVSKPELLRALFSQGLR